MPIYVTMLWEKVGSPDVHRTERYFGNRTYLLPHTLAVAWLNERYPCCRLATTAEIATV